MKTPRKRLDQRIVESGLAESRTRAQALIMAGKVLVDGTPADKPGSKVPATALLSLRGEPLAFVSRGGYKLQALLDACQIDVTGLTCLDVGASTGGFTDCLLQRGAQKVFSVDVGYGQLAWKLRQDARVVVLERTNIRKMAVDALPGPVDLATIDVSFISLNLVIPAVLPFLRTDARILALIKPQFEVGKGQVGKGGVVRNADQHRDVIAKIRFLGQSLHLACLDVIPSPILGPKGNQEFMIGFQRD